MKTYDDLGYGAYYQKRECPICGKSFIKQPQHVYHIIRHNHNLPVCSWSCQRKWEKQMDEKLKAKKQERKYLNVVRKKKDECND